MTMMMIVNLDVGIDFERFLSPFLNPVRRALKMVRLKPPTRGTSMMFRRTSQNGLQPNLKITIERNKKLTMEN